ncbi:MAG: hypothetical protein RL208_370 [Pseudomonadota bacterium]|jgi:cell division protein FtsN
MKILFAFFMLFVTTSCAKYGNERVLIPGNMNNSQPYYQQQNIQPQLNDPAQTPQSMLQPQPVPQVQNNSASQQTLNDQYVDLTAPKNNQQNQQQRQPSVYQFNEGTMSLTPVEDFNSKKQTQTLPNKTEKVKEGQNGDDALALEKLEKKQQQQRFVVKKFYVQVGLFAQSANADNAASFLKSKLDIPNVMIKDNDGKFKVLVGPYDTKNSLDMQKVMAKLANSKFDVFFVVNE